MKKQLVFTLYERFAHWSQAVLIILLMVTGFEVKDTYHLMGYRDASEWHRIFAWTLIGLWAFFAFWNLVTGEWKQYIPTTEKLLAVIRYYSLGIFQAEVRHPYRKTRLAKHNPLQRLAYLGLFLLISPVIWISGLLYMYYNGWPDLGLEGLSLGTIAFIHTAAAFAMMLFLIGHVYVIFTATPITAYLKAMITGYDEIDD